MKVAVLLGSLNRGGTETLLLDVFNRANDAKFEMIGIFRKGGDLQDDYLASNVSLSQLFPKHVFDFRYFFKLRNCLKKNNISIVHAQQPIDAFYAYCACLFTNIKIILSLHGYDYNSKGIIHLLRRFVIRKVDALFFVSNSQADYYKRKYKNHKLSKNKVIYNGIDFDKYSHDKKILRNELRITGNGLLLGSVGNFVEVRDQLTVCKFLKLLNDAGLEFNFLFVGAKDMNNPGKFDECVSYCRSNNLSEKVIFLGSRSDVPAILSQLDAFIYSSNHDTFGIAVVEAMAKGLPVFINDWEVLLEIMDQGRHGVFYKTKDENDLLIKFLHFVSNKQQYIAKAREDATWVRKRYSIQSFLNKLANSYKEVIGEKA